MGAFAEIAIRAEIEELVGRQIHAVLPPGLQWRCRAIPSVLNAVGHLQRLASQHAFRDRDVNDAQVRGRAQRNLNRFNGEIVPLATELVDRITAQAQFATTV